eukprot:CAMPEP_0171742346 /NCGR_PEP_ID=MMETSP0991-20121206/36161_1 /TAXON_ID=483369 /ORGANISM="non described non described, Strain CCMP2098" /LENGTH=489 /DNA_ID=CAMNT_0012340911 /DNA_START=299 /DNA_END=1769 /DNA_ORIENTATION=-
MCFGGGGGGSDGAGVSKQDTCFRRGGGQAPPTLDDRARGGGAAAADSSSSSSSLRPSYLAKLGGVNGSARREGLQKRSAWSLLSMHYDIRLSDGRAPGVSSGALSHVSFRLMNHYSLLRGESNKSGEFMCDVSTFRRWVDTIAGAYVGSNPYHSEAHAADVVQTANSYLDNTGVVELVSAPALSWKLSRFVLLVAAAAHDVKHPARMNPFLVDTKHPLTLPYAEKGVKGVLEAMHADHFLETLRLPGHDIFDPDHFLETLRLPGHDIFEYVAGEAQAQARQAVVELVLATDLSKQADILGTWNAKRKADSDLRSSSSVSSSVGDAEALAGGSVSGGAGVVEGWDLNVADNGQDRILFLKLCIMEEFYQQGDDEQSRGLPVLPQCDRSKPMLVKIQKGFLNFVVKPIFDSLSDFSSAVAKSTGKRGSDGMQPALDNLSATLAFLDKVESTVPTEILANVCFPSDLPLAALRPELNGIDFRLQRTEEGTVA